MVKLEGIVKRTLRSLIVPISLIAMNASALGQNLVSGNVNSVPSMNSAKAKVRFVNKSNGTTYSTLSDSATGNFNLKLPNGNYIEFIEAPNNFQYKDTLVNVNGNKKQNISIVENLPTTSTYYNNVLEETKDLTLTKDTDGRSVNGRMTNNIQVNPRNYDPSDSISMPNSSFFKPAFDSALTIFHNASNEKINYTQMPKDSSAQISFQYPENQNMPVIGAFGYTTQDNVDLKTRIILHNTVYVNRDFNTDSTTLMRVFSREHMRTLGFYNVSRDPSFVMVQSSGTATQPSHDEGLVIQVVYSLPPDVDYSKFKDTVITAVNYSKPSAFNPVSPVGSNISTPANFKWTKSSTPDNPVIYGLKLTGPGLDTLINTSDTSAIVANLKRGTNYSWTVFAVGGNDTTTTSTVNFTTVPNHAPAVAKALKDTTVLEDSQNVVLSTNVKQNIVDVDNDNLTYSVSGPNGLGIKLSGDTLSLNLLPKFYGNANSVILTATDPFGASVSDTAFVTVNHVNHAPSSFFLVKPSDNDTVKYNNVNIPITWTAATDSDNDSLTYLIHFKGNGVDTTISTKNLSTSIPSAILKPSSTYNIDAKVTDSKDSVSVTNPKTLYTADKLTDVVIADNHLPKDYSLSQNYPNPFNPTTRVQYSIPKRSIVKVEVFDVLGKLVSAVSENTRNPGTYETTLDMKGLSSGMYVYRMTAYPADNATEKPFIQTKKMLLLK